MNKTEMISLLELAKKEYVKLQEKEEKLYQDTLKALEIEDDTTSVFDYLANDYSTASKRIGEEQLKRNHQLFLSFGLCFCIGLFWLTKGREAALNPHTITMLAIELFILCALADKWDEHKAKKAAEKKAIEEKEKNNANQEDE